MASPDIDRERAAWDEDFFLIFFVGASSSSEQCWAAAQSYAHSRQHDDGAAAGLIMHCSSELQADVDMQRIVVAEFESTITVTITVLNNHSILD